MELKEKIEDLTALVSVESALNDLIKVVCVNSGENVGLVVYNDPEGYPHVHVYVEGLIGGKDG